MLRLKLAVRSVPSLKEFFDSLSPLWAQEFLLIYWRLTGSTSSPCLPPLSLISSFGVLLLNWTYGTYWEACFWFACLECGLDIVKLSLSFFTYALSKFVSENEDWASTSLKLNFLKNFWFYKELILWLSMMSIWFSRSWSFSGDSSSLNGSDSFSRSWMTLLCWLNPSFDCLWLFWMGAEGCIPAAAWFRMFRWSKEVCWPLSPVKSWFWSSLESDSWVSS